MLYNNLIHDKKIINTFTSYVNNQKLPHAIIFYGSEGRGKFLHAIELCNMILSRNNDIGIVEKKIKTNQHENINYILPLPKSKSIKKDDSALKALSSSDLENIQSELKNKLGNPYYKISIDKANTILINSIRDIKKKISLSNINNNWNIYIILDAEKLCYPRTESANALLKILEEPNENNLFILITSNISQMLETITSRCSKQYFSKLLQEDINKFITNNYNIDSEQADIISNLSNGNITTANKIASNYDTYIHKITDIIDLLFNFNLSKWQKIFSKLKDKSEIIFLLNLVSMYFNDMILFKTLQSKRKIRFSFLHSDIIKYTKKYRASKFDKILDIINETKKNLTQNVYHPLLITTFYLEIHQVLSNQSKKKMNYNQNPYLING